MVNPFLKVTVELPELFQLAPFAKVTRPLKIGVAAELLITRLPLVPPPMVVVLDTNNGKPATVKVVPLPVLKLPPIDSAETVVAEAVPPRVRLPVTEVVPEVIPFAPVPDRVRLV